MARKRSNPNLAVAYIRVSTDKQALSPDAQRHMVEQYAARAGVEIVAWFEDIEVSRDSDTVTRPGFTEALVALRTHRAGVFLAAKRDRLAGDRVVARQCELAVQAVGAVVRTADGTGDLTGVARVMATGMADLFSEIELAHIRQRTRDALAVKRARGERVGTVPFGYRVADDGVRLERDEREQSIIAMVRELRATGMSAQKIADALTARQIFSRTGRPFAQQQVHKLVTQKAA